MILCYGDNLNRIIGISREDYSNGKLYYESGALREDYHYYNDKEDGLGIIYFENSQKIQVENYKDGLKVGNYYQYFEDSILAIYC